MKISRVLIPMATAILSLHLAPAAAAGQQLDIWTWRNPAPTPNQLYGVTHGLINGSTLWVAVGANSTIVTSSDGGTTWSLQAPPSPLATLDSVAYSSVGGPSANHFVAVGSSDVNGNDVILFSPDGTNWTAATVISSDYYGGLFGVAYGNGHFMAVGFDGYNYHSTDGISWTEGISLAGGGYGDANGVAYGLINGVPGFVAVGDGGVSYTTDFGDAWTVPSSPMIGFFGVTWNSVSGEFVAVGYGAILNSPDGVNWFETSGDSGNAVAYGKSQFVAVNASTSYKIYTSSDDNSSSADTWTANTGYYPFDAIDFDGVKGNFVAVGPNGTIATSTDGTSWIQQNSNVTTNSLNAIAYGSYASPPGLNLFVAGGTTNINEGPGVIWSVDGYNWIPATDPSIDSSAYANAYITGLASGNNEFVATVNTLSDVNLNPRVFSVILSSSTIGLQGPVWTPVYTSPSAALTGVAFGNGNFVAVGNQGTAVWSTSLSTWTKGTGSGVPPSLNFNAVAYGSSPNGISTFVAVGKNNSADAISYSIDGGMTWSAASGPPSSDNFTGVAYGINPSGQPVFVAVAANNSVFPPAGFIWTSIDGCKTWQQQEISVTFLPFSSVTYANGFFVATTLASEYEGGGNIWVSPDGANWVQTPVVASGSLNAAAYGDYQYIAVGAGGDILGSVLAVFPTGPNQSGFIPSLLRGTPPCFWFNVMGPPGPTYGVYVSTDLMTWNWLQNVSFSSSPIQQVTDCGGSAQAFYYLGPPGP